MSDEIRLDQSNALAIHADRLVAEFHGIFSPQTVRRALAESLPEFQSAKIQDFMPLLAARYTHERLGATARLEGKLSKEHPIVLFVCVHNAGRSQMAAAFTRQLGEGRIDVRSAGSTPADEINPTVVEAMREVGLDLSQELPKRIADEIVRDADVVITMGCGDACPIYPGKKYEDWELDDPSGQPIETVRLIRDEIRDKVQRLVIDLVAIASRED